MFKWVSNMNRHSYSSLDTTAYAWNQILLFNEKWQLWGKLSILDTTLQNQNKNFNEKE